MLAARAAATPAPSNRPEAGTGTWRRTESSTTIKLALISSSPVNGTSRAVQPASPCARARA